jgi:hypothetical protein
MDPVSTSQAADFSAVPLARTTTAELLVERSRRRTISGVLDRLGVRGGQFAERRADGSGWSAQIPCTDEKPE